MVLMIGRVETGLISMAPNLLLIMCAFSFMGFAGIPLDMFTILIGSIAIGLVVDDTLHFLHHFHRYFLETADAARAVEQAMYTTGRAILITTLALSLGFATFMFSEMRNLHLFGLLTATTIVLALLADFLLLPAWLKQGI